MVATMACSNSNNSNSGFDDNDDDDDDGAVDGISNSLFI